MGRSKVELGEASQDGNSAFDALWCVCFASVLALLAIRFLLAYRLDLLPPSGVSLDDRQGVYARALASSLLGLWVVPAAMLVIPAVSHRLGGRKLASAESRAFRPGAWAFALPVAVALAGAAWHAATGDETMGLGRFQIRISFVVHISLVLAVGLAARAFVATAPALTHTRLQEAPPGRYTRILVALAIAAAFAVVLLFVKDAGFFIYIFSFLPILALLRPSGFSRDSRSRNRSLLWTVAVVFSVLTVCYALPLKVFLQVHFLQETPWVYRFATWTLQASDLLHSNDAPYDVTLLLRNIAQDQQMKFSAAVGRHAPTGYLGSVQAEQGISFATAVAECTFSTQLLAEHGWKAAAAVLGLYLNIMLAAFRTARLLPSALRHRAAPLAVIGGFYGINALYMACANLGAVAFTGQNMPLLSLASYGDLVQSAALLFIMASLMPLGSRPYARSSSWQERIDPLAVTGAVASVFSALFIWSLIALPRPEEVEAAREERAAFTTFETHLPTGDDPRLKLTMAAGRVRMDTLEPSRPLSPIEEEYRRRFNSLPIEAQLDDSNFYYLDPVPVAAVRAGEPPYRARVNRRYLKLASPYTFRPGRPAVARSQDPVSMWPGAILAADFGEPQPTFAGLGFPLRFAFRSAGPASTVFLQSRSKTAAVAPSSGFTLRDVPGAGGRDFCDLDIVPARANAKGSRVGGPPEPEPRVSRRRTDEGWSVYVDGKRLGRDPLSVPKNAIVTIVDPSPGAKAPPRLYHLIHVGTTSPVLACTRWRNGAWTRVFPQPDPMPQVKAIAAIADRTLERDRTNLRLALDTRLNHALQTQVEAWASERSYIDPGFTNEPEKGKRVAVTVMDAFTGEVLALPTYPYAPMHLSAEDERRLRKLTYRAERQYRANHNLEKHIIGSTIKPLTLAVAAVQLNGPDFDIADMRVRLKNPGVLAGMPLKPPIYITDPHDEGDLGRFLTQSLKWPQLNLSMLMLIRDRKEASTLMRPAQSGDIRIGKVRYHLDYPRCLPSLRSRPFRGDTLAPFLPDIRESLLLKGMERLFDSRAWPTSVEREAQHRALFCQYLPSLMAPSLLETADETQLAAGFPLDYLPAYRYDSNALPDPVVFGENGFDTLRQHLYPFFIGGNECQWSNVAMAQAAARIATGMRVEATFEARSQPPRFPPLVGGTDWWTQRRWQEWRWRNLLLPMERAGVVDRGTAASLRSIDYRGYRAFYKTGTLGDKEDEGDTNTLMFIVGKVKGNDLVPSQTVAGYLSIEKAGGAKVKFSLAKKVIPAVVNYLALRAQEQTVPLPEAL